MRNASAVLIAALAVGLSLPALAQGNKENGHGHGGPPPGHAGGPPAAAPHAGTTTTTVVMVPDRDRTTIHTYYHTEYSAGRCPPGLAKKHNGCMPPGLEKKRWEIGRPLPADVSYERLPPYLLGRVAPPAGYEYVRVANDILMMEVGTRMIAGAVADLSSF